MFNMRKILLSIINWLTNIVLLLGALPLFLWFLSYEVEPFTNEDSKLICLEQVSGNCFLWALDKFSKYGGYICIRRSKVWHGPHVLWMPPARDAVYHFVPKKDANKKIHFWNSYLLVWFKGWIKRSD